MSLTRGLTADLKLNNVINDPDLSLLFLCWLVCWLFIFMLVASLLQDFFCVFNITSIFKVERREKRPPKKPLLEGNKLSYLSN